MKKLKSFRRFDMDQFELRRLHPYNASDIIAWNKLLQSSQTYFLQNCGAPARNDAAQKLFSDIPKGKTESDKYVFALFDGAQMIGFADLIRGYPRPEVVSIRLFIIAESHQGAGLGADLFARVAELTASWNCQEIQLGVCASNTNGLKFWQRAGF
ncbi:MAG TPA: GNAT family N-acetyltransferase, partial [Burkholderiaceae bacterium]|nr:GNAT family N-acetyltransferase [Burkholderiaceae bacterium]